MGALSIRTAGPGRDSAGAGMLSCYSLSPSAATVRPARRPV